MLKLRNPQSLPAKPEVGLTTVRPVIDISEVRVEEFFKIVRKIAAVDLRQTWKSFDEGPCRAFRHDGVGMWFVR